MAHTEVSGEVPFSITDATTSSLVADAFSVLGSESRLAILLALWEASDGDALSFSELYDRVELHDSGQFNYHLDRLLGLFVRKSDDGYLLRNAGAAIIEAVIAGTGFENPTLEPVEIDVECPFCGAPTAVGYEDELLYQVCTECEGRWKDPDADAVEDEAVEENGYGGRLFATPFDPAGLSNRTPREIFVASTVKATTELVLSMNGICPACSGPRESSLYVCDDHSPRSKEVCPTCRTHWGIFPRFVCAICKSMTIPDPSIVACFHPAVIDFYNDHGITVGDASDPESFMRFFSLVGSHDVELISENPRLVRVTVRKGDDELSVTYDEAIRFVDVRR